jgi:hypothetical protein
MTQPSEWRQLAEFGGSVEADVAEAVLRAQDIPVIRRGPEVGIFGPGFTGATAHGVSLFVPADRLAEAEAALEPPPG